ncbi:MAG: KdsC family phosphatase [Bacteroidota bacterium]
MNQILAPSFEINPKVLALAAKVKLLLLDVDGVLTDARLIIGDDGQEYKAFNSRDGHGIKMLQRNGVATGIITGRTSEVVKHRVRDLDIKHVHQGCKEKHPVYRRLIGELGLQPEQTAYVGDDVVDLPIMLEVGLAIAVQNAHPLVRQNAHWITPSIGGYGAAREACEMIMYGQGTYQTEMQKYLAVTGNGDSNPGPG